MPEPFDPYLQWLEIEPHEMPADHYRLLGIRRFENDLGTIAAAADQRMSHVRTFQTGPRAASTQKLLNELAVARICLLNPGAKASYDQVLEAVFFMSAPPPQFAQIAVPPIAKPTFAKTLVAMPSEEEEEDQDDAEPPGSKLWVTMATVSIVLFAGLIAALVFRQQQLQSPTVQTSTSPIPRIDVPQHKELDFEESKVVLLFQEADGRVNLDASFAQLHGPTLRLGMAGNVNVIDEWESMDDWVSWTFKVVKSPPQGIFQVRVTYAARTEADGGSFVIAVGDQQKECEIRGTGAVVTDEYFLAIPNSGEHTLTVRAKSKPSLRLMTLKSVNLSFE